MKMNDSAVNSDFAGLMPRRKTRTVTVGQVRLGGGRPVVIQSMTNTDTVDVVKTAIQCAELARAGSELVRITVNTPEAAAAVPRIRAHLDSMGVGVPLIGDFHYNGHRLLSEYPECAQVLDKYRINPGNVGHGKKRDEQFAQMIEIACKYGKPVRIGVNWGSLDQDLLARIMDENARRPQPLDATGVMREAMVASALESAAKAEEFGLPGDHIILSCKVSGVQDLIGIYRELSRQSDYALHLGLTEAGMGLKGTVSTTAALSVLLLENIGDTIRVSLTGAPLEEIKSAKRILKTLGLRKGGVEVVSCPTCGRTRIDLIGLANKVEAMVQDIPLDIKVAVMGCVVNGPGEAKEADIGIAGGVGVGLLIKKGEIVKKVPEDQLLDILREELLHWEG